MSYVITVGREFGSGGRELARKVSELLGYRYIDKELLELASVESGYSKELFEEADEKLKFMFGDGVAAGSNSIMFSNFYNYQDAPTYENLYLKKSETIKRLASSEDCVIVGRCANYVLREYENVFSVFIYCSDMDKKAARVASRHPEIAEKNLITYIKKTDKKRANYHNYYTDQVWGDNKHYDLCVDIAYFGVDKAAEVIVAALKAKFDF